MDVGVGVVRTFDNGLTIIYHAPSYSTAVNYSWGMVVMYGTTLFQCIACTSGQWNPACWQETTLERMISDDLGW